MTYYERIDEMRDTMTLDPANALEIYTAVEAVLVSLFAEQIKDAEILSTTYGTGKVVEAQGSTLDNMFMEIAFASTNKRFAVMPVITGKVLFTKFADIIEIGDAWDHAFDLHTDITLKYNEIKSAAARAELEAKKKIEADKKSELKYQKLKEKAIKDFDNLVKQSSVELSDVDEFYYSLGWLTNHVGSISATMPDYLSDAFKKQFGADAEHRSVDSKKKTTNGNAMQWTFGFKATLRKPDSIPAFLTQYLSSTGKAIASTSFIWDLVDNYGFQFGKKQNVDRIIDHIPSKFIASYEAGMLA